MSVRIPHRLKADSKFSDRLERIRCTLGLSFQEWADRLQLSVSQAQAMREGKVSFTAVAIENLADDLGVSFEDLMTGNLDYGSIKKRLSGDASSLPERYTIGANSKRRTSIHLLKCIEAKGGWGLKHRLLRHYQMDESAFLDPDLDINILFVTDVCKWLKKIGVSQSTLYEFGSSSYEQNRFSSLGRLMGQSRDTSELLENVFINLVNKYFDKNCIYRLTYLDNNCAIVEAIPNPEVTDALSKILKGRPQVGSESVCCAKAGSFSSLTGYIRRPFMKVTESSCVHRGDPVCRFVLNY